MSDEKRVYHALLVYKHAKMLSKGRDLEVYKIASLLHDEGKEVNDEDHEIFSLIKVKKYFGNNPDKELEAVIKDCVLNHRSSGTPLTVQGRIFQQADILAKKDPEWIKFKERIK